jgi:hypothetical protein
MAPSVCCYCNGLFEIYRNPTQTYCAKRACQNARKQRWRRQKLQIDASYQENKKASQSRWSTKNPTYWQEYRERHPAYTSRNRQQQRVRQQRKRRLAVGLAQEVAIKKTIHRSEYYQLVPVALGDNASLFATRPLAKSDALIVKISLVSAYYEGVP